METQTSFAEQRKVLREMSDVLGADQFRDLMDQINERELRSLQSPEEKLLDYIEQIAEGQV